MTRDLSIALALGIAGFLLTAGMSFRRLEGAFLPQPQREQRHNSAARWVPPAPEPARPPSPPANAFAAKVRAMMPRPTPTSAVQFTGPAATSESEAQSSGEPVEDQEARKRDTLVPLIVWIRKSNTGAIELSLRSLSSQPGDFDLTQTDSQQAVRAALTFSAAPYGTRSVGADDGWQLSPGDKITVRSPPYKDRVITVP